MSEKAGRLNGEYTSFKQAIEKFKARATPGNWDAVLVAMDNVNSAL